MHQWPCPYWLIFLFHFYLFHIDLQYLYMIHALHKLARWFEGYAIHKSAGWFEGYTIVCVLCVSGWHVCIN